VLLLLESFLTLRLFILFLEVFSKLSLLIFMLIAFIKAAEIFLVRVKRVKCLLLFNNFLLLTLARSNSGVYLTFMSANERLIPSAEDSIDALITGNKIHFEPLGTSELF
jgi:hypothetical protein